VEDKFSADKKKFLAYDMLKSLLETYRVRNEIYAWDAENTNN